MADILQVNTELPADFTPTASSGLTDEEAASRKPNISHHRPDKSTAQILAENLFTPFNGLNVALAVCLRWWAAGGTCCFWVSWCRTR